MQLVDFARLAIRLPTGLDRVLTQATRGDLVVQTSLAPDHARSLRRIERSVDRLTYGVLTAGLLVAGALLRSMPDDAGLGTALLVGAGLAFLWSLTRR